MPFRFLSRGISFSYKKKKQAENLLLSVIKSEKKKVGKVHLTFSSDKFLHLLNKKFLKHDTLTDVITFDYSEGKTVSGEIYISIQRVKENAKKYKMPFEHELKRVMIHGILHLCGYRDKEKKEIEKMKEKENYYLETAAH